MLIDEIRSGRSRGGGDEDLMAFTKRYVHDDRLIVIDFSQCRHLLPDDKERFRKIEDFQEEWFDLRAPSPLTWVEYTLGEMKVASFIIFCNQHHAGASVARFYPFDQSEYYGKSEWAILAFSVISPDKGDWLADRTTIAAYLNKDGSIASTYDERHIEVRSNPGENLTRGSFGSMALGALTSSFKVVALLNVKNIVRRKVQPKPRTQKQRRRGDPPNIKTYVLDVHLPKTIIRPEDVNSSIYEPSTRPLHQVMGHLADYREKGLFGKYRGIFYIPTHYRGKRENGVVEKSYNIKSLAV